MCPRAGATEGVTEKVSPLTGGWVRTPAGTMPQLRDGEQRVSAAQATMPRVMSANIIPGYVSHNRYMRAETSTSFGYDLQTAVKPDKTNNLKVRPLAAPGGMLI